MKRIITILLFVTICVIAHANWLEVADTSDYIVFINNDINIDEYGHHLVWFKYVPRTHSLTKIRKDNYREYKKKGYLKYTHHMNLYKYNLRENKSMLLTTTYYASEEPIETINYNYISIWQYPIPESLNEAMMEAVKLLVKMQESNY